ncbi:Alpha/Beta hydrolase protein [Sphaerosporella brunnea]|uniref:Alpha/Beta hydrolase protein n=1 Tax=Sphaerosporella brunnea TaxID=1250544 RepID=A0A5J5EUJ4_9PEZI|nr:Alpha/Beta hydrolase protein [Sphaerosporella brunnea]
MLPRLRPPRKFRIHWRVYSTKVNEEARRRAFEDPRVRQLDKELEDEFAVIRETYRKPKHPIVLCHGLMGFDKLRLAGDLIPGIEYWRGIEDHLKARGIEVIVSTVPPTSTIERRAEALAEGIRKAGGVGRSVNLVGGIDARYMISKLKPNDFKILSLTTVSTPHHGSSFADYMLDQIEPQFLLRIYGALHRLGFQTGAFSQLTTRHMKEIFNPSIENDPSVSYYSYGAYCHPPPVYSIWHYPHRVIHEREGANDGLVSVESAHWGTYEGTLVGVNHLGIINWVNRIEYGWGQMMGWKRKFNALAFYLEITDKLAERGF